jgi:putative transposase
MVAELPIWLSPRMGIVATTVGTGSAPVVNAKRVYRVMRTHHLLLERKPADPQRKRAHKGRVSVTESNRRWCSDGFEFVATMVKSCGSRFAQDCCDREIIDWAASTGGSDKERCRTSCWVR